MEKLFYKHEPTTCKLTLFEHQLKTFIEQDWHIFLRDIIFERIRAFYLSQTPVTDITMFSEMIRSEFIIDIFIPSQQSIKQNILFDFPEISNNELAELYANRVEIITGGMLTTAEYKLQYELLLNIKLLG